MKTTPPKLGRQITIPGMAYAPTVELGVVFLFGRLAPQLGFCVESVHPHFPDCLAVYKGERVRIEFEFRASSFKAHPHKGADWIICWENDWEYRPAKYRQIKILSLKANVGAQQRIYAVGCDESLGAGALRSRRIEWNVPVNAEIGDLVLMYRKKPTSAIRDLWEVIDPPKRYAKNNKEGYRPGIQAGLRKVVSLKKPLTFAKLNTDIQTKNLAVIRKRFQGKTDITEQWSTLFAMIVALNPKAKTPLRRYVIG